ncbi:peptidylprolyl isomerase [Erythrobacter sp. SDW2]|uniref:peptidylprolyl isomerase n=1 Tax=Erythrobacter sp. SDW2 TaxID=2907154 RepID=UPI001F3D8489|nr:peptidylprolyl isomerase [Erythrobacter sp. SDW2]UIP07803.1 peptidylprolyl isomerase [Erythrobacter sp. SDW2]
MKKHLAVTAALAALAFTLPLAAQDEPQGAPSPGEIVAAAPASDWVAIPAEDLLVMTLAPDAEGNPRQVVIQLMPAPFSQGWVSNIRTLARAKWYDNISVNRVQDNYVVQWGDPNYDNPEATGETKPLPEGLKVMGEDAYIAPFFYDPSALKAQGVGRNAAASKATTLALIAAGIDIDSFDKLAAAEQYQLGREAVADRYSDFATFAQGWPIAGTDEKFWPTHCYGMVGVGRNYSPDTGSGAELYTVIGHAPRHLDRNIALVGRVISGMEFLSSLPRGKGDLGFYAEDEFDKRTPILTVRVASDLPEADPASSSEAVGQQTRPRFEYLSTESESFARYADARANRRDPFFIVPAGGADICNIPVPVRPVAE